MKRQTSTVAILGATASCEAMVMSHCMEQMAQTRRYLEDGEDTPGHEADWSSTKELAEDGWLSYTVAAERESGSLTSTERQTSVL
jgi:hypothetical protein